MAFIRKPTPIVANFGRFGPFILHDGTYVNLESAEEVFTIGINRAVDMLAAKRAKGFTPRGRAAALKDLGAHPDGTGTVQVSTASYGALCEAWQDQRHAARDKTPETMTLDEAVCRDCRTGSKGSGQEAEAQGCCQKERRP